MKVAALLVAALTVAIGVVGLVSPDTLTMVRRLYFSTPDRLYAAGGFRLLMGLVVVLRAGASRAPRTLRALGAAMCLQAAVAIVLGRDRAHAVLEWETLQGTTILRVGAAIALATGAFIAFAVAAPELATNQSRRRS